jgi:rod shape-determining protein MreC
VIESDSIYAKVLSDKNSPFLKSIIINKGSKHGINRGSVVKDNEYLVGKIIEVNFTTSRVLLLSDINSKIPVLIEPQGIMAILSGSQENNGTIQYSRIENIIDDKSIVYTSGTGNLFKAGIPVGKIIKTNIKSIRNNVEFFSDFSQLKFVRILFLEKKASE